MDAFSIQTEIYTASSKYETLLDIHWTYDLGQIKGNTFLEVLILQATIKHTTQRIGWVIWSLIGTILHNHDLIHHQNKFSSLHISSSITRLAWKKRSQKSDALLLLKRAYASLYIAMTLDNTARIIMKTATILSHFVAMPWESLKRGKHWQQPGIKDHRILQTAIMYYK